MALLGTVRYMPLMQLISYYKLCLSKSDNFVQFTNASAFVPQVWDHCSNYSGTSKCYCKIGVTICCEVDIDILTPTWTCVDVDN